MSNKNGDKKDKPSGDAGDVAGSTAASSLPVVPDAGAADPAAAAADESAPSEVTLAHLQAMHSRLLKVSALQEEQAEELANLRKVVDATAETFNAHVVPGLNDLHATVTDHAELLDGVTQALTALAPRPATPRPINRGDAPARVLPASTSTPGSTGLEVVNPRAPLAPGQTRQVEEVVIDPTKVGQQVVDLPSGGKLEINVRRPGGGGGKPVLGTLRDGRRSGGTRRG